MENIMMPANYLVLNEEEMTYTEGGATAVQAFCAVFVPFYGWIKGITAARNYRRAHPDTWMDTGMDALIADMEKSTTNLIYDWACTAYTVSSCFTIIGAVINAVVLFS